MGKEESMLAMFHRETKNDFENGNAVIKEEDLVEKKQAEKIDYAEIKKVESCMKEAVRIIKSITLEDEYIKNKEQKNLLIKSKEQALDKLIEIFRDVKEYLMTVKAEDDVKLDRENDSQESYAARLINAENVRIRKHDALVSDIQSTIRFIAFTFGQINPKAIEKWEDEKEEKGLPVLKAKRQKFPKNVFCPDDVDSRDRKQIARWAQKIFEISLDEIKKGLA